MQSEWVTVGESVYAVTTRIEDSSVIELNADKTTLTAAPAEANELLSSSIVGNAHGPYPQSARDAFASAVQAALAVHANGRGQGADVSERC